MYPLTWTFGRLLVPLLFRHRARSLARRGEAIEALSLVRPLSCRRRTSVRSLARRKPGGSNPLTTPIIAGQGVASGERAALTASRGHSTAARASRRPARGARSDQATRPRTHTMTTERSRHLAAQPRSPTNGAISRASGLSWSATRVTQPLPNHLPRRRPSPSRRLRSGPARPAPASTAPSGRALGHQPCCCRQRCGAWQPWRLGGGHPPAQDRLLHYQPAARSLRRPSRAPAHCAPRTITGRA
jgi:hypothetical protein